MKLFSVKTCLPHLSPKYDTALGCFFPDIASRGQCNVRGYNETVVIMWPLDDSVLHLTFSHRNTKYGLLFSRLTHLVMMTLSRKR